MLQDTKHNSHGSRYTVKRRRASGMAFPNVLLLLAIYWPYPCPIGVFYMRRICAD